MKLNEIPFWEKPREKVLEGGVQTLSSTELVAILLRCGTKNKSVLELSNEVLKYFDDIEELKDITIEELIKINGIGVAKATTILAAVELGKRISTKKLEKKQFITPISIFYEFSPLLNNTQQEHLYAVYLDNKGFLIQKKLINIGNLNSSFQARR